ncbi:MAG: patatin-like phospholipase family protein [Bacteroidota bacterium]
MSEQKDTFHMGVCMAGAISAGAYTAGVIDYLLEALENWEKAKKLQEEGKISGIPKHSIVIDVLSGASAGGMTAALTSALIQTKFTHVYTKDVKNNITHKLTQNPLYHSWVNLTESEGLDMMTQMLSGDDIEENNENTEKVVKSLFNSTFIKTIANRHIVDIVKDPEVNRSYFAADLDVVATLTNLRGIPFEIEFNTPSYTRIHRMKRHFDLAHFRLSPSGDYMDDGKIPLNFNSVEGCNKDILVQCAMATGGFPIGLEPRVINRLGKYITDNHNLNLGNRVDESVIKPDKDFETLNIDGGTINNDPFEFTQQLLDERLNIKEEDRKINAHNFESTVLMIDPFPSHNSIPEEKYNPLKAFKFVIPKIISAMLGELRMKEDVLKSVYKSDDYTRFLIIPSRSTANSVKENHIACGSFGGFGGFFSKEFRQHDFLLGRRNCQQFLKKYFSVPYNANNPIIDFGYQGIKDSYAVMLNKVEYLPIIPDIRINYDEATNTYSVKQESEYSEEKFAFPRIKLSYLLGLKGILKKRISTIIDNITNGKDTDKNKKKNQIVASIRKKTWIKKAISSIAIKPAIGIMLWLTKKSARGILADKFIDLVVEDMDDNELLIDDRN